MIRPGKRVCVCVCLYRHLIDFRGTPMLKYCRVKIVECQKYIETDRQLESKTCDLRVVINVRHLCIAIGTIGPVFIREALFQDLTATARSGYYFVGNSFLC